MKISKLFAGSAIVLTALFITSCTGEKVHLTGNISDAKDSLLYFENMSLNGAVTVDSMKLGADGAFAFEVEAVKHPEFYRLRIARQIINIGVDSTETISVKASYPTMSAQYEISGSEECNKIKELALLQMELQSRVNSITQNSDVPYALEADSIQTVLAAYKDKVKHDYIFKAPNKAYSYFALFQTFVVDNRPMLIFDPRSMKEDIQVFAAVATSWDTFYPGTERGQNLHNIALEGMKNMRIVRAQNARTIDASRVSDAGVIEIALPDNKGVTRKLTELKGKVVMLDFHVFATESSTARIMQMRELYNKYHAQGFEIYQVSLDPDEHFWKEKVAALPWVCVHDEGASASESATLYNVQNIPTFFLIDKNNVLQKRDVQIKDIDAEIKSML